MESGKGDNIIDFVEYFLQYAFYLASGLFACQQSNRNKVKYYNITISFIYLLVIY